MTKVNRISAMPRPAASSEPEIDPNTLDGIRSLRPYEPSGEPVECVVCNSRSIQLASPDAAKRIVGYDSVEKTNIFALVQETFGPGQTVSLPRSEYERLKASGFVCDPADFVPLPPRKTVDEMEVRHYGPREQ